jgi:light-regulated signal transduction histidine kinase (bacteriophytochrome)
MDADGRKMTLNIQLNDDGEYHPAIPSATIVEARTTHQNCEEEAIRIPGSIQRHGFLLLLDEAAGNVVAASENAEEFLGVPLKLILAAPIEAILEREVLAAVRSLTHSDDALSLPTFLGSFKMRGELHSVVTHRVGGARVLEFERLDRLSPSLVPRAISAMGWASIFRTRLWSGTVGG